MLPKNDGFARALVVIRKWYLEGNIIGSRNSNPFLDTCIYELKFQDGSICEYVANLISGNLFSQRYPDGNDFLLLNDTLDHRSNEKAVNTGDTSEGDPAKRKYKKTTAGWKYQ